VKKDLLPDDENIVANQVLINVKGHGQGAKQEDHFLVDVPEVCKRGKALIDIGHLTLSSCFGGRRPLSAARCGNTLLILG